VLDQIELGELSWLSQRKSYKYTIPRWRHRTCPPVASAVVSKDQESEEHVEGATVSSATS
jgi:hypothetical protein